MLVKPFPDAELYQFIDRKQQGSKGKKVQERLESSIKGFHDAFTITSEKWRSDEQAGDVLVNIPMGSEAITTEEHEAIHTVMRDTSQTSDANQLAVPRQHHSAHVATLEQ